MGEYQRAFFDYSAAIRLDENHGLYYCNRGICLRKVRRAAGCVCHPQLVISLALTRHGPHLAVKPAT